MRTQRHVFATSCRPLSPDTDGRTQLVFAHVMPCARCFTRAALFELFDDKRKRAARSPCLIIRQPRVCHPAFLPLYQSAHAMLSPRFLFADAARAFLLLCPFASLSLLMRYVFAESSAVDAPPLFSLLYYGVADALFIISLYWLIDAPTDTLCR